jgi:hypothetical protein
MRRLLLALVVFVCLMAATAQGERAKRGNLIVTVNGEFAPVALPRDEPAPVSVKLEAGLQATEGAPLPRVTKVEMGIPGQGTITTRGLPTCTPRRLRDTTPAGALAACRPALIGSGQMVAQVKIPNQPGFAVHARLLAFNGRVGGHRAVIAYGIAKHPPTVVVLPFVIRLRPGRFGTFLTAHLPPTLGPWPHFARFEMNLHRRYTYRGQRLSYLSASCPLGERIPIGIFSFAKATFTLADGRRISKGIARTCRAR